MLRLKSGRYTAERPIQLGGLLAGAPPETLAGLSRYGAAVGEAFQLQDDLLGMFGDADTVGKPVGADLQRGEVHLPHPSRSREPPPRTSGGRWTRPSAIRRLTPRADGAGAADPGGNRRPRQGGRDDWTSGCGRPAPRSAGSPARGPAAGGRLFFAGLLDYLWEREQ